MGRPVGKGLLGRRLLMEVKGLKLMALSCWKKESNLSYLLDKKVCLQMGVTQGVVVGEPLLFILLR